MTDVKIKTMKKKNNFQTKPEVGHFGYNGVSVV